MSAVSDVMDVDQIMEGESYWHSYATEVDALRSWLAESEQRAATELEEYLYVKGRTLE